MCINEDYNIVVVLIAYFIERINCFLNTESIQLNYEANRGGQGNGGAIYWLTNMIYLIPN